MESLVVHIMWLVPSNSSLSDWLRQMPKVFSHHLAQGVPNFNNQGKMVRWQSFPKEIFHRQLFKYHPLLSIRVMSKILFISRKCLSSVAMEKIFNYFQYAILWYSVMSRNAKIIFFPDNICDVNKNISDTHQITLYNLFFFQDASKLFRTLLQLIQSNSLQEGGKKCPIQLKPWRTQTAKLFMVLKGI